MALNASGQVTGWYTTIAGGPHGFLRSRDDQFVTFDVPGALTTFAQAINPAGQITGYYFAPDNHYYCFVRNSNGSIGTTIHLSGCFPQAIAPSGEVGGFL